jgi:hypothetical protein
MAGLIQCTPAIEPAMQMRASPEGRLSEIMQQRAKVFLTVLLALAVVIAVVLWPRKPRASLPAILRAAPAGASQVVYLDLVRLRESGILQKLSSLAPEIPVDPEYVQFVQSTGFDYTKDLDRLLIVRSANETARPFVLAEGRFDRQKITRHVLQSGGIEQRDEFETLLLPLATNPTPDAPERKESPGAPASESPKLALAFVEPGRIALGRSEGFAQWLHSRRLEETDPEMFEQILRMAGSAAFLTGKVPPPLATGSAGMSSSQWEQIRGRMRWYALAIVPQQKQLLVVADVTCLTESACAELAETLETLRAVVFAALSQPKPPLGLMPHDAAFLRDLLSRARIVHQKNLVRARVQFDPATLAENSASGR